LSEDNSYNTGPNSLYGLDMYRLKQEIWDVANNIVVYRRRPSPMEDSECPVRAGVSPVRNTASPEGDTAFPTGDPPY
jgi:hypothetical protein